MKTKKAENGTATADKSEDAAPEKAEAKPEKTSEKGAEKAEKTEKAEGDEAPAAENYVVASKVKAFIKDAGYNCGGDLAEGLSKKVTFLLKQAVKRAESNGRKTVRRQDL